MASRGRIGYGARSMRPDWYPPDVDVADRSTHWSAVDTSPRAPEVRRHLLGQLAAAYDGRIADTESFLRQFVTGQDVLDIGAAQHAPKYVASGAWKHAAIATHARRVVGIDIAEEATAAAVERGYDIRIVDATSDADLGERFDRIHLGDVIEHVDNPVALLRFAERHLRPGGLLLAVTPNPFFLSYVLEGLREGVFLPNAEHVSWITPTLALELAARAGLRLERYYHTGGEGKTLARKVFAAMLRRMRRRDAEMFSAHFYYVFARR